MKRVAASLLSVVLLLALRAEAEPEVEIHRVVLVE